MSPFKRIIVLFVFLLSGCASVGPKQICLDRNRYADVIQYTNNQQLLDNIVSARYLEPMFFFKLINVTSSYSLSETSGNSGFLWSGLSQHNTSDTPAGNVVGGVSQITRNFSAFPAVNYADNPTISYAPVVDEDFIRELMTPIPIRRLQVLFAGGIDEPTLIFRLVVQSMNGFDNASSASSEALPSLPVYEKYYDLLDLMIGMLHKNQAQIIPQKMNDNYVLVLHFNDEYKNSANALKIKQMLKIRKNNQDIIFSEYSENMLAKNHGLESNIVYIKTRSVYGIMTYLSYGIDIPEPDIKAGYVFQYYTDESKTKPFDWEPLLKGLMTIHSSNCEPRCAFVKVYAHCHWFYIKQSDLASKVTFTFLTRLITLSAGKEFAGGPGPVLTIPTR